MAVLLLAVLIVYRRGLSAYFFDDDFQWLVGTWGFSPLGSLAFWRMTHFYRPIIDAYFAAATSLFNGSPQFFHAANIALHAANTLVLFALARRMFASDLFAFVTALIFAVQPADVDAIVWVSALAEPLSTLFGCLSLLWFLRFCATRRPAVLAASVVSFAVALVTHESSIVFLPIIALADWAFVEHGLSGSDGGGRQSGWMVAVRRLAPYAVLALAYLVIDVIVNSRNYVVVEGHYRLGFHAVRHLFDYVTALYVGRRGPLNDLAIVAVLGAVCLRGNRRAVFAVCWLVLALLPFSFFTWSNTSRYLYLSAMGFSMLVTEGVFQIDRLLRGRVTPLLRQTAVALLVGAFAFRLAVFATQNVSRFSARTEEYRRYLDEFRLLYGPTLHDTRISPDARLGRALPHPFVNALVQWEYRDPTIQLVPYEQADASEARH